MPNETNPQWEAEDAAELRSFLATSTGSKFYQFIHSVIPWKDAESIEEEALNFRFTKGCRFMLGAIDAMASKQPETDKGNILNFVQPDQPQS